MKRCSDELHFDYRWNQNTPELFYDALAPAPEIGARPVSALSHP